MDKENKTVTLKEFDDANVKVHCELAVNTLSPIQLVEINGENVFKAIARLRELLFKVKMGEK